MITINPRVDFVFKKLFGTEENKDLLINLLNSIISEADQVKDLVIRNPYNAQNFKNEKLTILDIKAQDNQGKWFNVEMQIVDQDYYAQRALYYWSRLYTEQLAAGINYDCLKKTIGIKV
jgi:predicted transposase/invertase (TIGR01784 family)